MTEPVVGDRGRGGITVRRVDEHAIGERLDPRTQLGEPPERAVVSTGDAKRTSSTSRVV